MIKSYVIDTNILIQAPYACQCFEENRVILPLVVLEELDGLKKAEGEKGANARRAIRFLEKLRRKGDLLKGVQMGNGGIFRVETNCVNVELPESLQEDKPDNRILKVCKGIREEEKPVVLVTKDLVLRLKAQILGIEAQDFSTEQVIEEEDQYSGRQICYVAEDKFKEFKKKGIRLKELYLSDEDGNKIQPEFTENGIYHIEGGPVCEKDTSGKSRGKESSTVRIPKESALWNQTEECRTVFLTGSIDEIRRESTACNCKRNGRNGEDVLFTGSRTGEGAEQSDRRI